MRNLTLYTPKTLWDPFRSLGEIHDEFDRLFDNMMPTREQISTKGFYPVVDILEENDKYLIKAELPGVNQKDVKVTISDNLLTIEGERKNEYEDKKEGIHRIERSSGAFCRSFRLNGDVANDKITAKSKDGVLEITIPKSEKAKPKEISVKVE
jgi:HSP20 family protein